MTCSFCKGWLAETREQYKHRLQMLRNYPVQASHPCPVCMSVDWMTTPPPGVSTIDVKDEIEREHKERMRLEERRAKGRWFLFWRRKRSP